MVHYQQIRKAGFITFMSLTLLATAGCGIFSKQAAQEIDPPPAESQGGTSAIDDGQAMQQGEGSQMTVYLKDRNNYIAPVTLQVAVDENRKAEQLALEMMVDSSEYANQLPEGFQAILPKGTQVKGFNYVKDQKLAIVDLSASFTDYSLQDERRIVEAITWTLTGFPDIERVVLWNEGEKLREMPVDGFPLDEPLTRKIGINLEKADGVDFSRSMPVTLYFSSVTPDDLQYYVPVTRLVDRSEDVAKTAMQQLIAGPLHHSSLTGVMTPDIEVRSIAIEDDIVTVDLLDDSHQAGQKTPAEMIQAVILSITENTGTDKVQIQMNGQTDVTDTNNRAYDQPVNRPDYVNPLKL
ncbi:GerMN domain-containing protein [Paenibacillus abyssi]|uniref:Spore germination protein GerM n=1 Tax=Paenibacillus abyssi TaxID=1340531 RepID=A0A917LFX9_9BACL|nr:GerMN domain-containing protein [Paenibacillus abyssi]GGG20704.1 spore germination protein GerM [Paenibacillus abyssi]